MSDEHVWRLGGWLSRAWAMEPGPCEECGRPMSVVCVFDDARERPQVWTRWCHPCHDPHEHEPRATIRWVFGEVRYPVVDVTRPSLRPGADLCIWTRRGVAVSTSTLQALVTSFSNLATARMTYRSKPGEWALEVREDGRLWAPWCPTGFAGSYRAGKALPYREGRLGKSGRVRTCLVCKDALEQGDVAWRPDTAGSTLHRLGWDSEAMHRALVCQACSRKARTKGVRCGPDVVYGHLRLLGGDRE